MTSVDVQPDLEFVLPGSWRAIPLDDPQRERAAVRRLVADTVGSRDDRAKLRAELREAFATMAARAREAGGRDLYLAGELIPGLSIPSALVVAWPDLRVPGQDAARPEAAASLLREALVEATNADPTEFSDAVAAGSGVVRRARRTRPDAEAEGLASAAGETVIVDYWLTVPSSERVVVLSFSSALAELEEALLALYDAIVSTVLWRV
ncbi:hypothetical protein HQQ80_11680 [Microbacteriaceae bacterium VKM Ac-2855]|nr:hypothetical protein [Microbacteriaceae bacterium VKM Ac-2855]